MNSLDARSQILLKTLIERYIADGQPVGSRALSRFSGLELSPATVRKRAWMICIKKYCKAARLMCWMRG